MISALGWVPRGAADPRPKKYEISPAELRMLKMRAEMEAGEGANEDDQEEEEEEEVAAKKSSKSSKKKREKKEGDVDISDLPADLRMDEYSSDEEDGEGMGESSVGNLIVGRGSEMVSLLVGSL